MKMKKISTKMLCVLIPTIILVMGAFVVLTLISIDRVINEQVQEKMNTEMLAEKTQMSEQFSTVEWMAGTLAKTVSNSYKTTSLKQYEKMLDSMISDNDMVLGSGLWFEPYVYNKKEKYIGPYVYKDGDKNAVTYDYSNSDYDYFSQDYYIKGKECEKLAFITDPYYDETLDTVMATCVSPMKTETGKFIGVVTVDIELTQIQESVNQVKIGTTGSAMLLNREGQYLSCKDSSKIMKTSIQEDSNASLAELGKAAIEKKDGNGTYTEDGKEYVVYYSNWEKLGWTILLQIQKDELRGSITRAIRFLIAIAVAGLAVCTFVILWQVQKISKQIKNVQQFAISLSAGDFTIEELQVRSADELGVMGNSLNTMYSNNKTVIQKISNHAESLDKESNQLSVSSGELKSQFDSVEQIMRDVNEDMLSNSAATEEVNASVEEANASINLLTEETVQSTKMVDEIKKRAKRIEEKSNNSCQRADELTKIYETNLYQSIENAKIVDSIGELAEVISSIAEQINLLSLNASIEAARAGEQGKGFAVVASEIGKLANDTSSTVNQIKDTITKVQESFSGLTNDSKEMLAFVSETVAPDYKEFLEVAQQYGSDAEQIEEISTQIAKMTKDIEIIVNEVSQAIENIAVSSQNTAQNSIHVMDAVNKASDIIESVSKMSEHQADISLELNEVVSNFKL
ncbi:methyl-accepting chemotaxis protein [Velocimicrobium porci]|uniref:Methyl-accepting chemotaxis protein n=1 Tax=Velocimicrobium porci TaxID=2606634 RepID=A0A6L5Y2L9_9FIRM|nr:methyl-accepting chemotaxis protein [Velocimicrobium porci]MSS65021.1 methyl-accepting chemotaxis protein [Velocimicrobium porci]